MSPILFFIFQEPTDLFTNSVSYLTLFTLRIFLSVHLFILSLYLFSECQESLISDSRIFFFLRGYKGYYLPFHHLLPQFSL